MWVFTCVGNHITNAGRLHRTAHSTRPGTVWPLLTIVFLAQSRQTGIGLGHPPLRVWGNALQTPPPTSSLRIRKLSAREARHLPKVTPGFVAELINSFEIDMAFGGATICRGFMCRFQRSWLSAFCTYTTSESHLLVTCDSNISTCARQRRSCSGAVLRGSLMQPASYSDYADLPPN